MGRPPIDLTREHIRICLRLALCSGLHYDKEEFIEQLADRGLIIRKSSILSKILIPYLGRDWHWLLPAQTCGTGKTWICEARLRILKDSWPRLEATIASKENIRKDLAKAEKDHMGLEEVEEVHVSDGKNQYTKSQRQDLRVQEQHDPDQFLYCHDDATLELDLLGNHWMRHLLRTNSQTFLSKEEVASFDWDEENKLPKSSGVRGSVQARLISLRNMSVGMSDGQDNIVRDLPVLSAEACDLLREVCYGPELWLYEDQQSYSSMLREASEECSAQFEYPHGASFGWFEWLKQAQSRSPDDPLQGICSAVGSSSPDALKRLDWKGDTLLHAFLWHLEDNRLSRNPSYIAILELTALDTAQAISANSAQNVLAVILRMLPGAYTLRDKDGWTPLQLACSLAQPHIVATLLNHIWDSNMEWPTKAVKYALAQRDGTNHGLIETLRTTYWRASKEEEPYSLFSEVDALICTCLITSAAAGKLPPKHHEFRPFSKCYEDPRSQRRRLEDKGYVEWEE